MVRRPSAPSTETRIEELAQKNDELSALTVRLQQALQAKDAFMAGMSHELRTPLSSILGYTGTLLMGLHGSLNETQNRHLKTIQRNSEHLLSLVDDLLDLAKIGAGALQLHPEAVNCQFVIDDVVAASAPLAAAKRLSLHAGACDPPPIVFADGRAVRQILLNLVGNAIKFTERGAVEVQCRPEIQGESAWGLLEVRDTGPGLSNEDLEKIFQPFSRLAASEDATRGTGLGLYLSRELAQQMQGSIRVDSKRNVGSVFTLVLPLT